MMDMMNNTGSAAGLTALWGVHALSVVLFFVGVILLILWAAKTLNQGQLKTWGITLAVVGTIACLLTIGARGAPWGSGNSDMNMKHMQMMEKMMGGMMDDEDSSASAHHMGMNDDAMSMSMDDMAAMLEGKTGDAFDKAFIEGMIPHHQGAIDMAEAAQKSAKHEEIKRMADAIISAQQQEIDQMNQWMKDWGYIN
jgi:uncharacterized membrane protein (UPF0136 family)